jgi:hypothetical protein
MWCDYINDKTGSRMSMFCDHRLIDRMAQMLRDTPEDQYAFERFECDRDAAELMDILAIRNPRMIVDRFPEKPMFPRTMKGREIRLIERRDECAA